MKAIAESHLITVPLLDFGGFGGPFTARTLIQVATGHVESVKLDGGVPLSGVISLHRMGSVVLA